MVSPRIFSACPTHAAALAESLVLELPHLLRESLAGLEADEIRVRNGHVVERDLGGVARAHAQLLQRPGHRHTGQIRVDEEQRDAAVPRAGLGLDDERQEVGPGAVGDEHLAAVDDPRLAVSYRARRDVGDVRAGVGLGDGDRADLLARDRGPQVALTLFVRSELRQRGRRHVGLHRDRHRDRARPAMRQLLDEHDLGGKVAAGSAPTLGVVQPEEAQLAATPEDPVGEVARRFPLVDRRRQLLVDEPSDGCAQLVVLGREDRARNVHTPILAWFAGGFAAPGRRLPVPCPSRSCSGGLSM